jgi:hypothetical protein
MKHMKNALGVYHEEILAYMCGFFYYNIIFMHDY